MLRWPAVCCAQLWMIVLIATSSMAADVARVRDSTGDVVATRVSSAALVHTGQLMPPATAVTPLQQGEQVLQRLSETLDRFSAKRADVAKLNVSVRDVATRVSFSRQLSDWFGDDPPAVAYVASPLPSSRAAIGLDAIIAIDPAPASRSVSDARAAVLPAGDVVYISGQAAAGRLREATRETMAGLLKTIEHLGLKNSDIVQVKCFVKPIHDVAIANAEIASALGAVTVPIVHVEWTSASRAIEIEVIVAAAPQESDDTVSYLTPPWMKPSPVFSRVARIHGDERIYTAGLYPKHSGSGMDQVKSIFSQLERVLHDSGSDLRHLAKATYYVSDDDASAQLNKLRPEYYDPERPPAASKAAVTSVASEDLGITIDLIAAPTKS